MKSFAGDDINAFCNAPFFQGLSQDTVSGLFNAGKVVALPKDTFVSTTGDNVDTVYFVLSGLLRVSACSESGRRVTFLLVKQAEPYNLLGPYLDRPRFLEAQAIQKTKCLRIRGSDYLAFVENHPDIVPAIIRWIGMGLDSANSRILEIMEKKVETRILRVLNMLHEKFGSPLLFTSQEIAEIAGTTPESTLRTMGVLREMGIIVTQRSKIWIQDGEALKTIDFCVITI